MYAIIESGGKQYRVRQGDTIRVEKLPVDVGDTITFDRVLLVSGESGVRIGEPIVAGAGVTAEALDHDRDKKVRIVKFRRRKHSLKRQGHRQYFTTVKITNITE